jgi:hypothetical protein
MTAALAASKMTRAVPRARSAAAAQTATSAAIAMSAGSHAVMPGAPMPLVGGETPTKTAIPAATHRPPAMDLAVSGRRLRWAISGRAKSTSSVASGWTSASGPKASAAAWIAKEKTVSAMPPSQRRSRASVTSSPSRSARACVCRAAPCWISDPSAKQSEASSASTTAIAVLIAACFPSGWLVSAPPGNGLVVGYGQCWPDNGAEVTTSGQIA